MRVSSFPCRTQSRPKLCRACGTTQDHLGMKFTAHTQQMLSLELGRQATIGL